MVITADIDDPVKFLKQYIATADQTETREQICKNIELKKGIFANVIKIQKIYNEEILELQDKIRLYNSQLIAKIYNRFN